MIRREEVTTKVKVLDIIAGDPAHLLIAQAAARPDGTTRTITQKLRVLDTALFFRLRATVKKGDEIEATIVTELSKNGYKTYYSTYLFDFQAIPS
jgi:hypothetical protein